MSYDMLLGYKGPTQGAPLRATSVASKADILFCEQTDLRAK